MKRSQQKKVTVEAKTLRYMRVSRGISQREAGRRCQLSEAAIGHYENGRGENSMGRILKYRLKVGRADHNRGFPRKRKKPQKHNQKGKKTIHESDK